MRDDEAEVTGCGCLIFLILIFLALLGGVFIIWRTALGL